MIIIGFVLGILATIIAGFLAYLKIAIDVWTDS